MSLILALDSSRRRGGSVALVADGKLVSQVEHDPARGYAEAFFELADRALEMAGKSREEIDTLAVVIGPGSYTGLRIGVMTAKSLAHANGVSLFAATSLELLAGQALFGEDSSAEVSQNGLQARSEPRQILALMEAGRDAVYVAQFELRECELSVVRSAWRALPGSLVEQLKGGPGLSLVSADGPETLELIRRALPRLLEQAKILAPVPMARTLALAVAKKCSWCSRADPATLLPVYLGPSQAERALGVTVEGKRLDPRSGK